ncbi:MAG: MFS transporter, partial [Firmicutes bacterium]|nr:MFS transporter [Bacillota bacterium]
MKFILLVGTVSLFADMTYEGARSITGPFLYLPGASAGTVGLVSGLGEFTGYAPAGYSADRTRRYWLL